MSPSPANGQRLAAALSDARKHFQLRDGPRALAAAMKSVEMAPDSVEAHLMLARVLEAGGRLADAQHHYQEVVRRSSTHLAALTALGRISLNAGDWKSAISLLERAVTAHPGDIDARHFLARSYGLGLRHRHALTLFRTLVGEAPDNPEIRAGFARSLALDGETGQALEQYEQAARLSPADYKIQQGLSEAYLSVGRKNEAEACQRNVLRLDPARGAAWFQLARMNALSAADIDAIGEKLRDQGARRQGPRLSAAGARPPSRSNGRRCRRVCRAQRGQRDPRPPAELRSRRGGGPRRQGAGRDVGRRPRAGAGAIGARHFHRRHAALGNDPGRTDSGAPPQGPGRRRTVRRCTTCRLACSSWANPIPKASRT